MPWEYIMDELTLQISGISVKDGKKQACVRFTDNERYAEGTIPDCVIIRSEGFTNEEELSIYDILVKPELSKDDIVKVKSVSIELLQKIKEIIAGSDHWSEKLETRASVDIVIRDTLWDELPECYDNSNIDDCRDRISRYIYERFGRAA